MKGDKTTTKIVNEIYILRGQKVMFDKDLAELYGVEVKVLNQAVKRNLERFPEEFCFKLSSSELAESKSQIVTLSTTNSRNYKRPTVFTEQGAYALSFVLKTPKAIETGIFIAKAFTHLRRFILKNENLMMELKNNDQLSTTFSNFEKRIEQNLIVLYKNNSDSKKKFKQIEDRFKQLEEEIIKLK